MNKEIIIPEEFKQPKSIKNTIIELVNWYNSQENERLTDTLYTEMIRVSDEIYHLTHMNNLEFIDYFFKLKIFDLRMYEIVYEEIPLTFDNNYGSNKKDKIYYKTKIVER